MVSSQIRLRRAQTRLAPAVRARKSLISAPADTRPDVGLLPRGAVKIWADFPQHDVCKNRHEECEYGQRMPRVTCATWHKSCARPVGELQCSRHTSHLENCARADSTDPTLAMKCSIDNERRVRLHHAACNGTHAFRAALLCLHNGSFASTGQGDHPYRVGH